MTLFKSLIICMFSAAISAGCAAVPQVKYQEVKGQDAQGHVKFTLAASLAKLDYKTNGQKQMNVTVFPTESEKLFAIIPSYESGVRTYLQVEFIDNQRVVKTVGTQVVDDRIKIIQAVSSLAMTSLPFAEAAAAKIMLKQKPKIESCPKLPVVIDIQEYKRGCVAHLKNNGLYKGDRNGLKCTKKVALGASSWSYTMDFGPVPIDAMETSEFFSGAEQKNQSVWPYSACRSFILRVFSEKDNSCLSDDFFLSHIFSDPDYVQTISLPPKGKVTMHTVCGANLTSEAGAGSTGWDIIAAGAKEAKSLLEEQKKMNK